jgi:hypothetical protein
MHLVFDPGPMPNNLVAASHQSAPELGIRIGQPDFREETRCPQRCHHTGVDFVCLGVSMCDRPPITRAT